MFREVNERIVEGAERAGFAGPTLFLCECGDTECSETIEVGLGEYEQARARATVFLVSPGHDTQGVERVLSESDRFAVVEIVGAAAAIAEECDSKLADLDGATPERSDGVGETLDAEASQKDKLSRWLEDTSGGTELRRPAASTESG